MREITGVTFTDSVGNVFTNCTVRIATSGIYNIVGGLPPEYMLPTDGNHQMAVLIAQVTGETPRFVR